jgi:hypothetical protein
MTPNELEAILRAVALVRPFRNFVIEFHSGDRLTVTHPEVVSRRGNLFQYESPDGSRRVFSPAGISQVIVPPRAAPGAPGAAAS